MTTTLKPQHLRSLLSLFVLLTLSTALACQTPEFVEEAPRLIVEWPSHPPFVEGLLIENRIERGTAHAFEISLKAGQALRIVVHQVEVDLSLALFDETGQQVAWMNTESGPSGPEPLAYVSEEVGAFRLQLKSPDATGAYRLAVARLGEARAEDLAWARVAEVWRTWRWEAAQLPYEDALALVESGLDAVAEIDSPLMRARLLSARGNVLRKLDRLDEAIVDLEQAVILQELHGKAWELAPLLNHLADAHLRNEDLERAKSTVERALEVVKLIDYPASRAGIHNTLGVIHHMRGEYQAAIANYQQSIELARDVDSPESQASRLYNLALLYEHLGYVDEALDHAERALDLWTRLGDPNHQSQGLAAIAWIHHQNRELERANEELEKALDIARQEENLDRVSDLLEQRALLLLDQGETDQAIRNLEKALELSGQRLLTQAYLRSELGAALRRSQPERARGLLQDALTTFREYGVVKGEISTLAHLARVEMEHGSLITASAWLDETLERVESQRNRLIGPDFRRGFFASQAELFALRVDLLLAQDRPREALLASEQARARALIDLIDRAPAPDHAGWRQAERRLRFQIRALESHRQSHLDAGRLEAAATVEEKVRQRTALYRNWQSLPQAPQHPARFEPLSLEQIQQDVLDDDSMFLVFHLGEDRGQLWLIDRAGVQSLDLPPREQVELLADRALNLLRDHESDTRDARKRALRNLAESILWPAEPALQRPRLVIVADGALQAIPFGALPLRSGERFLLEAHELVHLPSVGVLARLRERAAHHHPGEKLLAAVADPVFGPEDPRAGGHPVSTDEAAKVLARVRGGGRLDRLPFAGEEAEAILAMAEPLAGPDGLLRATGFDADLDLMLSGKLRPYRLLHFATHGRFESGLPALSGLFLSRVDVDGSPRPGLLSLLDLFHLDLPADLVVLSACETAVGRRFRGEGIVGPSHGFFAAGASRLVASYWPVNDRATAALMTAFYRGLFEDGLAPGQALRKAQLEIRQRKAWSAPYFWAGFALHGDWRPLELVPP